MTVVCRCDDLGLIHFTKSEAQFQECLENHTGLWNELEVFGINVTNGKDHVFYEFEEFEMFTISTSTFNETLTRIETDLIYSNGLGNNRLLAIKFSLSKAILDCTGSTEFSFQHHNIPAFVEEDTLLANILNYIMVDLDDLNETTLDFELLSSFCENVLAVLESAYSSSSRFRTYPLAIFEDLYSLAGYRFGFFFQSGDLPYPRYTYTLDNP